MPLANFSNLDFDQVKSTLQEYLKSNSNFTDYDFEGSNLSTILDVLAYNTYITSYNANMVTNEVFIDTATLRKNIVSLARNIGYTPRPRQAARASISFFVDTTGITPTPASLTLKKGPVAASSTAFGGQSFIPTVESKIRTLRKAIDEQVASGGRDVQLQIDGGVKAHNIAMLREWGVTNAVVGSGLFNANASVADNLTTLHQALND